MKPDIVIGREDFSKRLSEEIGCRYRAFRHEYHPDGEPCPRILAEYTELEGMKVVLVLRGSQLPEKDKVSRNLHNFSRHIGNIKYVYEAKHLDVLMPYFWLGRQDKNPKKDEDPHVRWNDQGRDVGYEWLVRDFKAQGADRIITFNPHFHREGKEPFYVEGLEIVPLSGVPALARYTKKLYSEELISKDSLLTGPDFGSGSLIEEFAKLVGNDFKILEKGRLDVDQVETKYKIDADGKDIIILDDIFSTLGTIEAAIESIENKGYVYCLAVHGVLPMKGFEKTKDMKRDVRMFVTTDTIDTDYSHTSVIPEIVDFYKRNG